MERRRTLSRELKLETDKLILKYGESVAQTARILTFRRIYCTNGYVSCGGNARMHCYCNSKQNVQEIGVMRLRKLESELKQER